MVKTLPISLLRKLRSRRSYAVFIPLPRSKDLTCWREALKFYIGLQKDTAMPHYIHETCIGCTACATKCPTEAIVGDKKTMHVIIDDKCIDCGVCGNVCPVTCITDQFDRLVPKKKIVDRPRPVINKDNCTGC